MPSLESERTTPTDKRSQLPGESSGLQELALVDVKDGDYEVVGDQHHRT